MKNKEIALDWLKRARSNLERVRIGKCSEEMLYEDICFDAQQAAEQRIHKMGNHLNAKYLILHAGHGSTKHATDVLREIADDRLLIENMPKVGLNDEPMIGYSPAQIEELIGDGNRGRCLDLNHAAKVAVSLGVDYRRYVQDFFSV